MFKDMAAKDYVFAKGMFNVWLTKKKKPTAKEPKMMSTDRRRIEDGEIIGMFEFYLRKWCKEHDGESEVLITDSNGKKIFMAKLYDKDDD